MYKIGNKVCVICYENNDLSLNLIPAGDRCLYSDSDITEHTVPIVGIHQMDENNLICLCDFDPHSYFSFKINTWHVKSFNINNHFLDKKGASINPRMIWIVKPVVATVQMHLPDPGGCPCVICLKFIQYAAANLGNGGFVCRSCRQTKMYKINPYLKSVGIDKADVDWIKP